MADYCGNCGAELGGVNYCPECGVEVDEKPESTQIDDTKDTDTGTCEKCDSVISLEADRCPNCGYEPASHGWILSIIAGLSVPVAILFSSLILIVWIVALGTGFEIGQALTVTAFFGFFILPAAVIGLLLMNKERKTPTGYKKSWSQLFEDS